ncbi:MAG: isoaspartyl peptidase/L-asparaginase [Planctomycetes bacterium]|nr:isoaspartyl peptidase/L-asparaginase [Planctomycetota bacterium]
MTRSSAIPALIVHGGAWSIPSDELDAHREGCRRAARAGFAVLEGGGSALDAVVEAVALLEDDPTFNAGRGAHLDACGEIVLDAGAMRGDLATAGVAAVRGVRNPVRLARAMIEARTEAVLLVGDAARDEAARLLVELCAPDHHLVERERARFLAWSGEREWKLAAPFDPAQATRFDERAASDTVGAVARDREGRFAAATSTGGAPRKPAGRVGDSPIPSAGFYAWDRLGAASTTGHGESILKVALALRAVEGLERFSTRVAAEAAIAEMFARCGGRGGLILLAPEGPPAFAHNTAHMAVAWVTPDEAGATTGREILREPGNSEPRVL